MRWYGHITTRKRLGPNDELVLVSCKEEWKRKIVIRKILQKDMFKKIFFEVFLGNGNGHDRESGCLITLDPQTVIKSK